VDLSIVFVSTFPPAQCGIATYTKFLCDSVSKIQTKEVYVISEGGSSDISGSYTVINSYKRDEKYDEQIINALKSLKSPEIVHFQHAPDLFPDRGRFLSMVKRIKESGSSVVVTLHTVYNNEKDSLFYKELIKYSNIIVHNIDSKNSIDKGNGKINVIPHGTENVSVNETKEALKKKTGLSENDFVFLFIGFIHFFKNLHRITYAFRRISNKHDNLKLIVAGKPGGGRWYNYLYLLLCRIMSGFSRNIVWDIRFLDEMTIHRYLKLSDLVLILYNQKYCSASGILHLTIGSSTPFIVSDSPKFSEIKEQMSGLPVFIRASSFKEIERSMTEFVRNRDLSAKVTDAVKDYGERTSWDNVAKNHLDYYKSLISEGISS
jgi:glycosyltransferase involved in cell wall biosynthesis